MTAATAASKAKASDSKTTDPAAGKRKREALGEVTSLVTNNKGKGKAVVGKDGAVKEKFDGVVIKTRATTITSTATATRQPLKPASGASRKVTRTVTNVKPEQALDDVVEVHDEDAMAVDDQPAAATTLRRISTRKSTHSVASSHRVKPQEDEDDGEEAHVSKKRRTSSEAPFSPAKVFEEELRQSSEANAADLEAFADGELEADPEGDQWDDLDAEDADDPLMVSEYVVEIFNYMKEVEVSLRPFTVPLS